jgi:peptide/nickel transport system permease protein
MVNYAIKRLLYVFPTLLVVMVMVFLLSKAHRNDPAEAKCLLEGITSGHPNENKEYAKHYTDLGLQKPAFYLNIGPSFYHPNINSIVDRTRRQQMIALQKQKIEHRSIQEYLDKRDSLISQLLLDTTYTNSHTSISKTQFITDVSTLSDHVKSLPQSSKWTELVNILLQGKTSYYFPRIHWNGSDNQFHRWAKNAINLDFGKSVEDGQPISLKVVSALKWTLLLSFISLLFTAFISILSGSYSGFYASGWWDKTSHIVWMILYSIPSFWLASMLIMYCTSDIYGLHLFPSPGNWMIDKDKSFLGQVLASSNQLVLPILCLVVNDIAFFSRLTRNNVSFQKSELYTTMAMARGINERGILWRYVMPNSLIALITFLIGMIPSCFSGALIIEIVFNIPGMGQLMFESIQNADWQVVYAIVLIIAVVTLISMVIGDVLYMWLNPKIANYDETPH